MSDNSPDMVTWQRAETGYEKATTFTVLKKHHGTAPDFIVHQAGKNCGQITFGPRSAKQLADALYYLLGLSPPK